MAQGRICIDITKSSSVKLDKIIQVRPAESLALNNFQVIRAYNSGFMIFINHVCNI